MIAGRTLLYCASDREIYDFLQSSKQRITPSVMLELLKDRGIFLSTSESRSYLAETLATIPNDSYTLESYKTHGQTSSRSEKVTYYHITKEISEKEVYDALSRIRDHSQSGSFSLSKHDNNFSLKVEYSEWDHGKNALNQRRIRESEIEILKHTKGYEIRMPFSDKTQEIAKEIFDELKLTQGPNSDITQIDLRGVKDPSLKIQFFIDLIKSIPNYRQLDVTRVRIEADPSSAPEPSPDPSMEIDLEAEIERAEDEVRSAIMTSVQRVSIKGTGLLSSDVFRQLKEKGFFIASVVWIVKEKGTGSEIELEAGFEDPINGTNFFYNIRGYKPLSPRNPGELIKHMKAMPQADKDALFPIIEATALKIKGNITTPPRKRGKS